MMKMGIFFTITHLHNIGVRTGEDVHIDELGMSYFYYLNDDVLSKSLSMSSSRSLFNQSASKRVDYVQMSIC